MGRIVVRHVREFIGRVPGTHRYYFTDEGRRVALCYCRICRQILNLILAAALDAKSPETRLRASGRRPTERLPVERRPVRSIISLPKQRKADRT